MTTAINVTEQKHKSNLPPKNTRRGSNQCWKGAAAELLVASDLISKGYSVYSPFTHGAAFDLVAFKSGHWLRVEVKLREGNCTYWTGNMVGTYGRPVDCRKFDVLACVREGKINYLRSKLSPLNVASGPLVLGNSYKTNSRDNVTSTTYGELDNYVGGEQCATTDVQ